MPRTSLVPVILILAAVLPLNAQTDPTLDEEIVVTASALPEPSASTPASVTVIDRREIEAAKARDIADLLREVPGLVVSRSGSAGKATSLFTRGGNSTHTLVLWNGIEINNPYFAGYDWGRFSTAGVQQIEIVRGPFSALYGSDAVSGVVNVLTTRTRSGFDAGVEVGERELANAFADGALVSGAWNASGTVEHREDDGWSANDDFRQEAASGGLYRTFGGDGSIGLSARATTYDLGIPFNVSAGGTTLVPSLERRQEGSELQIAVPVRHHIGTLGYSLTLSQSSREDDFSDPEDPFGLTSASTDSVSRRAQLSFEQPTRFGTIVAGGEVERSEVDDRSSYGVNLEDDRRTSRALFVEDRASIPLRASRLEVAAGIRYDRFDTFGSATSPRVAVAWVASGHKIHASYGEGFRAPSIGELYFPFAGNPDLEPERSRSAEGGYAWRSPRVSWDLTLFRSEADDLIVFDNATFVFENVDETSSTGVEVSGRATIADGWSAAASYTWLDAEDEGSGRPLVRRPRHSGSLRVAYDGARWGGSLAAIHSGVRDDIMPVFPYSRTLAGAVTTVDASVETSLGRLRPYAKIENLFDAAYEEVAGYRAAGRRAVIGLRYSQ